MAPNQDPEVVTHRIPKIEVYQVTDDELQRIEDGCAHISQDLTFAVASISAFISFLVAALTTTLTPTKQTIFISIEIGFGVVGIYTGWRWWHTRRVTPETIRKIRSRRTEPQPNPPRS